jgi:hypothetical protein
MIPIIRVHLDLELHLVMVLLGLDNLMRKQWHLI